MASHGHYLGVVVVKATTTSLTASLLPMGERAIVRYTFQLEGGSYRVIRRKKQKRGTQLELQLGVGDGSWKTLSERKIRETQSSIEKLLKMNYDTFINASFLLQGKADEFTTKTAGKRKEILTELIGATVWDGYKEKFTEQRKTAEGALNLLDSRITDIDEEMGESETRELLLEEATANHAQLQARLQDKEQLLAQAKRQIESVKHQTQIAGNLADQLTRAKKLLQTSQTTQADRQQERAEYESLLSQTAEIKAQYAKWEQTEAEWRAWAEKERAFQVLAEQKQPHLTAIAQAESELKEKQRNLQQQAERVSGMGSEREKVAQDLAEDQAKLEGLQTQLMALAKQEADWHKAKDLLSEFVAERRLLEQQVGQLEKESKQVAGIVGNQEAIRKNEQEAAQEIEELQGLIAGIFDQSKQLLQTQADKDSIQAEQDRLRTSMKKLKEKIDRLETETGGECPTCGQPLTAEHREKVLVEWQTEGTKQGELFREQKERLGGLEKEIGELNAGIQKAPQYERKLATQQQRLATATAKLQESDQKINAWENAGKKELEKLQQKLADDTTLVTQQKVVTKLESEIATKTALEQEHSTIQKKIATANARQNEINRANAEWEEVSKEALAVVTSQLEQADFAQTARQALAELTNAQNEVSYDPEQQKLVAQKRADLNSAQSAYQSLMQAEAAVKPLERTLADLAVQLAEQENQLSTLTSQHGSGNNSSGRIEGRFARCAGNRKSSF